ncbi:MAG: MFS transporter [Propionibacteriaceae bacterium]|jgi:CP family cyanate transporter-like MFS transporter|nr:MFS transporter [Propionibacteriaceae bacterium]
MTVLAGMVVLGLNLRAAVTTVAPLLQRVRAEVAFSATSESLIAAAPPLMFALFGALAPFLGRLWGLERVVAGAMGLAAAGMAARVAIASEPVFLGATALIMAGLGTANVAIPPLIKRYFPDRIALMTSASTVFLVIGQAMPPVFATALADRLGWRFAVGIWAAGAALAAFPWLLQYHRQSRRRRSGAPRPRRAADPGTPVMRSPAFWGITGLLVCNSIAAYALMGWLPQLMADSGAQPRQGALVLAGFTVGSLVPALVVPPLTVRARRPWILVVAMFACWVAGLVGFMLSPLDGTWLWLALTRVGDGNYACAMTLMNLRTRRSRTLLEVSGFAQAIGYTCAGVATFAFGQLHAATGGWFWPLALLVAAMPLGLAGGLVASRPALVEDQVEGQAASRRGRAAT